MPELGQHDLAQIALGRERPRLDIIQVDFEFEFALMLLWLGWADPARPALILSRAFPFTLNRLVTTGLYHVPANKIMNKKKTPFSSTACIQRQQSFLSLTPKYASKCCFRLIFPLNQHPPPAPPPGPTCLPKKTRRSKWEEKEKYKQFPRKRGVAKPSTMDFQEPLRVSFN